MAEDKVDGGAVDADEPKVDTDGKHPETVSWSQYVGIKESLGNKLTTANQKVTSLEEQVAKAPNLEEHGKLKTELTEAKTALETATTELTTTKDASLAEKRAVLVTRGIPEDKAKELSGKEIDNIMGVIGDKKPEPKADMGGGTGAITETSTGKARITAGFESLHPTK